MMEITPIHHAIRNIRKSSFGCRTDFRTTASARRLLFGAVDSGMELFDSIRFPQDEEEQRGDSRN